VAALWWASGMSERVAEGSRGNEPQLRGVRGGIVLYRATSADGAADLEVGSLDTFWR
jgi:hypothetical protein